MKTLCRHGSGEGAEVTTCIGAELQNVRIDFYFCAQIVESRAPHIGDVYEPLRRSEEYAHFSPVR